MGWQRTTTTTAALLCSCSAFAAELRVPARRYTLADQNASQFLTELDNRYENEVLHMNPADTALVMIDVWDSPDERLMENAKARMLPLLALARRLGFLILHAPSEAPERTSTHKRPLVQTIRWPGPGLGVFLYTPSSGLLRE